MTVWTIGHSNHSLEVFLDLLQQHRIQLAADVRSSPYSGYAVQFAKETLVHALAGRHLDYVFLGDLLGGRPAGAEFYDDQGRVLYGRLAESPAFQRGIQRLESAAQDRRAALLCGEEDPTGCHRRLLVGRVLAERGVAVMHIRGDGRVQTEEELAAEQRFRKTKGQLSLFDTEETDEWKSSQSVLPRKAPPSSSRQSGEPPSDA